MGRILCVWWDAWALRRPDIPSTEASFAVAKGKVIAVNELAREAGLFRGMQRRSAESLVPNAHVIEHDPVGDTHRFEPLVQLIEEVVPRVEIVEPGLIFVPITGAINYYGGEQQVVDLLVNSLEQAFGEGARFGVADQPFAARCAAALATEQPIIVRDDAKFLASRDLSVLPNPDVVDTFRWLGIDTLGDLAALPRAAVASRFGNIGLEAHRLASGDTQTVSPRIIPEDLVVNKTFEAPLLFVQQVEFVARELASELMAGLRAAGVAPRVIVIQVESAAGSLRERTWRSTDPLTQVAIGERVGWQMRTWLESKKGVGSGIVSLKLVPLEVSGEGRQLGFLEDTAAVQQAEQAFTRLQSVVGPDNVVTARRQGGRTPAEQVRWQPWGEEDAELERATIAPWPGRTPGPAPSLVPPTPVPLAVEWDRGMPSRVRLRSQWVEVLNWAGPWRRVGRWWKEEEAVDEYQIVTSAGAILCHVRKGGSTFMAALYD